MSNTQVIARDRSSSASELAIVVQTYVTSHRLPTPQHWTLNAQVAFGPHQKRIVHHRPSRCLLLSRSQKIGLQNRHARS